VRQLFNVLRTAAVMAANEPTITREHLSDDFLEEALAAQAAGAGAAASATAETASAPTQAPPVEPEAPRPAPVMAAAPAPTWSGETRPVQRSLEEMEIDAIRLAVEAAGGNISEASKRLGISRNTIYRKLRWNTPK